MDSTRRIGTKMKTTVLNQDVYYYEDAVENFEDVMNTIAELAEADSSDDIKLWGKWTASNDDQFIYGETQTFDLNQINQMPEPYRSKMEYVYIS